MSKCSVPELWKTLISADIIFSHIFSYYVIWRVMTVTNKALLLAVFKQYLNLLHLINQRWEFLLCNFSVLIFYGDAFSLGVCRHKIMWWITEWKRPCRRLRHRWKDNIRMELMEIVGKVCTRCIWLRIGSGSWLLWV